MSQQLTRMRLDRVSLVDKGANGREFAVFKRAEAQEAHMAHGAPGAGPVDTSSPGFLAGLLRKAADLLRPPEEPISKTRTFASIVAGQELSTALDESFWTLQDALWSAIYAYDESGADLSIEAKKALVAQNLDEFKAYLLAQMESVSTGVAKRDATAAALDGLIAKEERKVSGARLERLRTAAEALTSVLAEVDDSTAESQEEDVDEAQLIAAVQKANQPLIERIEALEKRGQAAVEKAGDETDAELTLEGVAKAFVEFRDGIAEQIASIAKSRGQRTSPDGQDGDVKKRSLFAGVF